MTEAKEQQVSEMLERVARALFDAENIWREMQQGLQGDQLPERHFKVAISEYRMKARAAIASMRTPTEEMTRACIWPATDWDSSLEDVWQVMIDAALSGSSVGPISASVAPVLTPAEVSEAANSNRFLEPEFGPEGRS